jgi:hypothetical protein
MIVKWQWTSNKNDTKNWRDWEGWFLFGIIPLYIRPVS